MSSVDRDTILAYAHTLMGRIRITYAYLNTYKSLCDNGVRYRDAMNQTPLFFTMIYRSLVHTIMIDMCKLFEDDKQVLGIKKFYLICEQNQKAFLSITEMQSSIRLTLCPPPCMIWMLKTTLRRAGRACPWREIFQK